MSDKSAFSFVNVSKPSEALNPENRKLVRSNATLHRSRKRKGHRVEDDGEDSIENQIEQTPSVEPGLQLFQTGMKQYIYDMLQYSDLLLGPGLFPMKALYRYHPGHRMTMCLVVQDTKVLNSAVAIAALHFGTRKGKNSFKRTGLIHQKQALSLVQAHLNAENPFIDASTAICIAHLASLELFFFNAIGWQVHMDALKKISEDPKSSGNLSPVRYTIMDIDLMGCYLFDKQPNFIPTEAMSSLHPSGCAIARLKIRQRRAAIQSTFPSQKKSFTLSEEIIGMILDLQDLTSMADAIKITCPETHVGTFVSARLSVEYKLLLMTGEADVNSLSKTVCLAGQIYVNRVLRVFDKGDMIPHWIAERLKQIIISTMGHTKQDETLPDAMLWVAFMGGIGAKTGPLMSWFVELIYYTCNSLGLQSWTQIQPLLETWLWSEERLGEECMSLWQEVEEKVVLQSWAKSLVASPF